MLDCDYREGDAVVVLPKDAYGGSQEKYAGKRAWVVSTIAGTVPGLLTWVVFDKKHKEDQRRWVGFYWGGLRVKRRANRCMFCFLRRLCGMSCGMRTASNASKS